MAKILILTSDFLPNLGGIATDTKHLFNLLKQSHDVKLFAFGLSGESKEGIVYIPEKKYLWFSVLKSILEKETYDVVIVRTVLPLGWMLNLIKTKSKKIYCIYGGEVLSDINKKIFIRPDVKDIIKNCDKIVVNSIYTNSLIDNRGEIFYPIISDFEYHAKNNEKNNVIGCVGRLVEHKNYIALLKSIKYIDESVMSITGKGVKLQIVGDGQLYQKYNDFAVLNNISELVSFTKGTLWNKMGEFYSKLKILAVPSITTKNGVEGFGMVIQEAGLFGAVSVGYRSGGVPESIADDELLADENDEDGLKKVIVKLLSDEEFFVKKSQNALIRSRKYLAGKSRLEEFERIIF